jgi:type IV secretory pathway VirB10-like protein
MNTQLRLNVILPIVLFAVLAVGVGLFTLTRGQGSSSAADESQLSVIHRPTPVSPAKTAKPRTPTKPVQSAKPKPVKPAKPAKPVVKLNAGLPPALARALTSQRVAVVSFVTPDSGIDEMAAMEAAAGARAVGAAFVTVDVSRERSARPFSLMLGVLKAPSVLIFKRPGELFVQLDGFADLDTVAQAADNAYS